MIKKTNLTKLVPLAIIIGVIILFAISFIRGNILVKKSEKEINSKKQVYEAQAAKYNLKEIDSKTGQLRWKLTAKEGTTEENLQAALIKDVNAEVYKNNAVIFILNAPFAKANASTKEIYLFGEVTAKNEDGDFSLNSSQVALGMGTSIEAQKGFNLVLRNSGTVSGDNALINDDQTKIIVRKLKEASFKDIILSGEEVSIEKEKNGELKKATVSMGGKIILKNNLKSGKSSSLQAGTIKWEKDGDIEATSDVTYTSEDKTFKAGYLLLKPDKKIYAKNNVLIIHGETQCYGNNLSFENESIIVITGKPKALQGDREITADKIVYNVTTDKVEALGNVRTVVLHKQQDKI
ncbi:MAG: LPS export ABC transporter periplasmic protein LptC [Candidatus Melainabacteria bacterium]|nr:LPS export ABC transporter periplasmic protein LptC [Candidatus Melainabacteria bacterium]